MPFDFYPSPAFFSVFFFDDDFKARPFPGAHHRSTIHEYSNTQLPIPKS